MCCDTISWRSNKCRGIARALILGGGHKHIQGRLGNIVERFIDIQLKDFFGQVHHHAGVEKFFFFLGTWV